MYSSPGEAATNKPCSHILKSIDTHYSSHRSRVPIGAQSQQWNTVPITERDTVVLCSQIHEGRLNCSTASLIGYLLSDHEL